jgi:hypothetical protein
MWSWEEGLAGLLGGWKGTIHKTSSSEQKLVTGSQPTGETVPPGLCDRRATPRYRVQFRTIVSSTGTVREGMGTVLDLSLGGCRVEAPFTAQPSQLMELRIYDPDLNWPLMVNGAVVQWVQGSTFGLRFLQLRKDEEDRLAQVLATVIDDAEE